MNGTPSSSSQTEPDRQGDPCCGAPGSGLSAHLVDIDVRTLSALANETRYGVIRLLSSTDEEICACDLAPELDVDQSTTSRALMALYEAGLVDRRKEGRWRYYSTTPRAETILAAIDASRAGFS